MTMTFTEQQLRESLRRTTTDVPDAGDRVAQVQRRVRRRRQRTIAVVAASPSGQSGHGDPSDC